MDFIVKHYILIIVIAGFLIMALIGYYIDSVKNKKSDEEELLTKPNDKIDINEIKKLEQEKELKEEVPVQEVKQMQEIEDSLSVLNQDNH